MKASLLILLYLARDTLCRWLMRISSPLSRMLVVFFLSFCGLVFLAGYVISLKVLRGRIQENGGDLVVATDYVSGQKSMAPRGREVLPPAVGGDRCYLFRDAFAFAKADNHLYTLAEYPLSLTVPLAGASPLRLLPVSPCEGELPVEVALDGHKLPATTLPENKAAFLRRVYPGGAVFIPPDTLPQIWAGGYIRRHVVQVGEVSVQNLTRWESLLRLLSQLDQTNSNVLSGAGMMDSLQQLEGSQQCFRLGATLGISVIICCLLTSISTLEYRQNEYVYALIGSFGISRALLLGTFLAENTVLTALGFCAALAALQGVLPYITHVLYRSPQTLLELAELREDITLFCLAFLVCIAVSGLPILAAVRKPIGNVLK